MKSGFYSKIALDNIKKNYRLYIPRILAESGLLGCFYILINLALDKRLSECLGGGYLPTLMWMGSVVLGILSFILILYINSFLMKQRKNEYGLYNVLGLEKRHIGRILFFESFYTSMISVALGSCLGLIFYKLSSLLICKLLHLNIIAGFYYFNILTLLLPLLIYICFDFIAFIINRISIHHLKPVELLSQKHTGEKEPKVKWALLVIGIVSLSAGYIIALVTKSPLEALFLFFAAVILVIIGTYCLFITGSIFVLKLLKKNKKYYYNPKHMPSVSGLLFRMKQNAVGLASIAILSTCVLVMISTTVSLYSGVKDLMDKNYPEQLYLSANYESDNKLTNIGPEILENIVKEASKENNLEIKSTSKENFLEVSYVLRDGKLLMKTEINGGWDVDEITSVLFITENTYNQLTNSKITINKNKSLDLKENEIAFCRISSSINDTVKVPTSLDIVNEAYSVKKSIDYFPISSQSNYIVRCFGIIVSNEEVLDKIYSAQKSAYGKDASEYVTRIGVLYSDEKKLYECGEKINEAIFDKLSEKYTTDDQTLNVSLDTKWDSESNILEMYGTFLFLGILLGFVCLFSTILIIYYKQISEGYEDRDRFQIMEKIGMETKEIKKTIGSQLVLQFFLPLFTAAVHISVACPILVKLLRILMLSNTNLFICCTIITFVLFSLVYIAVYLKTAKTYYKIVK